MDLSLTEDQKGFKALARDFLDKEVVPYRAEWDRAESVDTAIIPKLGEIGFFGLTIPEEYGGIGGDYITYCIGMEELGRADSSVRGIVSVSMGLVGKVVLSHGTEEQKQQWLPGIASGTTLGCFGLTEPDTGSDAGNLKTRAVRDGGDWVDQRLEDLHHQRHLGRRLPGLRPHRRPRAQGRLGLPGPHRQPRVSAAPRSRASSACAARRPPSSPSTTSGCRPRRCSVTEGQGFRIAMHSLDKGRVSVAAGLRRHRPGLPGAVVSYARTRKQFGRQLASFQLIQDMIADISVDADAARLLDLARRRPDRAGRAVRRRGVQGEALRLRGRRPGGEPRHPGLRRLRLRRRVPRAEVHARRSRDDALRGHQPDPEAPHRTRRDRRQRVRLTDPRERHLHAPAAPQTPLGLFGTDSADRRGGRSPSATPCASTSRSRSSHTSPTGTRPARSPRGSSPRSSARWACSACTSRATAAPARRPRRTGSPAWSSRPATPACASLVSVQGSLAMFAIWKHGSRGAEGGVAAADGRGRGDRLLRPDRARLRLQPGRDAHPRPP